MDVIEGNEILRKLKRIDEAAYPRQILSFSRYKSWRKFMKSYSFKTEPNFYLKDTYYCLYTTGIIISFAASKPILYKDLLSLYRHLKDFYDGRTVKATCRKATSFRLIKAMAYKGLIEYRILETIGVVDKYMSYILEFRFI